MCSTTAALALLALLALLAAPFAPAEGPSAPAAPRCAAPTKDASPTDRLRSARSCVAANDLGTARAILAPLVQRFPNFGLAQLEWAELLDKLDAPMAERARALDAAARLEPRNPRVFRARCRHYDRQQAVDEAIASCARALELRPGDDAIALRLGILLSLAERDAEAIEVLQKALASDPRDGAARAHLAEACERAGDLTCAQREFEHLFQQNPRSALHARRLARFYERQGQSERAAAVLKKSGEAPRPAMRPLPPSRH